MVIKKLFISVFIVSFFNMSIVLISQAQELKAQFVGKVFVEWLDDEKGRNMKLTKPFVFKDGSGVDWKVPANTIINGASIPQYLWTILGSPYVGKYRKASVVHDHFWKDEATDEQKAVDWMFKEAADAEGATNSWLLYAGVRCCGRTIRVFGRKILKRKVTLSSAKTITTRQCSKNEIGQLICKTFTKTQPPVIATRIEIINKGQTKKISQPLPEKKVKELFDWIEKEKPDQEKIEEKIDELYQTR